MRALSLIATMESFSLPETCGRQKQVDYEEKQVCDLRKRHLTA